MSSFLATLAQIESAKIFFKLIRAAGFSEAIDDQGPLTIFVPNDEAFNELPEDMLEALSAGSEALLTTLKNHVVAGDFSTEDLRELPPLQTQNGEFLEVDVFDETITLDYGAAIITPDISFSDGVIQVIDGVLMP